LTAATAAAKEPVAPAQAKGSALVSSARGTDVKNMMAIQIPGASPLPPVPSGIQPTGPAYDAGALRENFTDVHNLLKVLYPFTTPDPEDAFWQRRTQVVDGTGRVPGMGMAVVPPEYFNYTQRKLNQLVSDQFKNFIFQQIDLTTPAAREFWETRFPEYTNEFRQGWKKRLGHMARMGDLMINGVQSMEDLWYLFITEKGLNPVAYQYQGPPNASQTAALFNMYQQTIFPNTATGAPRTGPPEMLYQPGFGQAGGGDDDGNILQTNQTGQVQGYGARRSQVYGQRPSSQY